MNIGPETALLIQPQQGQINMTVKLMVGGTLEIFGAGQTLLGGPNNFLSIAQTAAGLSALSGTGYMLGALEVFSINGPASFYLNARSATCVAHAVFTRGQGA
jgi:hypothetical protein